MAQPYPAYPQVAPHYALPQSANPADSLGPLQSRHPATAASRWLGIVLGGMALVGILGLAVNAAYQGLLELEKKRPHLDEALAPSLIGAVCLVPLAALFFFLSWRSWNLSAELREKGFALTNRKGTHVVRFDDIEAVWQSIVRRYVNGVYAGTMYTYTVLAKSGAKHVLDNRLVGIEGLGTQVVKASAALLFPRFVSAVDAGQRVTFGAIALDRSGMHSGSKSLGWNEIRAVKIERGVLSVSREGQWLSWAKATVPTIPNFYVLLALLRRFTKVE